MLRPDGSILSQPGYDEATGYYYRPPDGFMMPEVPEHPTDEQLSDAVGLVLEAICDFPFVDEASRTNTVALMLTPLVRNIMPTVPIALVDATNQGTGKTLLSEVCATVSCGSYELGTVPADSEEWRKRITSLLSEGTRFVILDNVRGTLGSDNLNVGALPEQYMRDIDIVRYDRSGNETRRWTLHGAWIKTLEYDELEGGSSDNTIEKLSITYQYWS